MRRASFMLTAPQMRARTKTQTRRLGWRWAQVGMVVLAVERCMGIRKGQVVEIFGQIRLTDVRRHPLFEVTPEDVVAEGFPDLTRDEFIAMFCRHMRCEPNVDVARVVFEHVVPSRGSVERDGDCAAVDEAVGEFEVST